MLAENLMSGMDAKMGSRPGRTAFYPWHKPRKLMKMISGLSQCAAALGKSRLNVQCCMREEYIRAAAANNHQEAPSQVNDETIDTATFPASNDLNFVSLGNDDQGELIPIFISRPIPKCIANAG